MAQGLSAALTPSTPLPPRCLLRPTVPRLTAGHHRGPTDQHGSALVRFPPPPPRRQATRHPSVPLTNGFTESMAPLVAVVPHLRVVTRSRAAPLAWPFVA